MGFQNSIKNLFFKNSLCGFRLFLCAIWIDPWSFYKIFRMWMKMFGNFGSHSEWMMIDWVWVGIDIKRSGCNAAAQCVQIPRLAKSATRVSAKWAGSIGRVDVILKLFTKLWTFWDIFSFFLTKFLFKEIPFWIFSSKWRVKHVYFI